MIYIISRTPKEATHFSRRHGIYPRNYRFVEGVADLKGGSGEVVFTGTYYERPDKFEIAVEVELGVEQGRLKEIKLE